MKAHRLKECKHLETEYRVNAGVLKREFSMLATTSGENLLYKIDGPQHFTWEGVACCPYRARAEAYDAYERHLREQSRGAENE